MLLTTVSSSAYEYPSMSRISMNDSLLIWFSVTVKYVLTAGSLYGDLIARYVKQSLIYIKNTITLKAKELEIMCTTGKCYVL